MFRRRGQVGVIAMTAIVTILVSVGVTYAVQNILATRQLTASARIVASGANLAVCRDSDTNCITLFTGPLDFGSLQAGTTGDLIVRIRNTSTPPATGDPPASDLFFVDARVQFSGQLFNLRLRVPSSQNTADVGELWNGGVPNIGRFLLRQVTATGDFGVSADRIDARTAFQPGEVRRAMISYRPDASLVLSQPNCWQDRDGEA